MKRHALRHGVVAAGLAVLVTSLLTSPGFASSATSVADDVKPTTPQPTNQLPSDPVPAGFATWLDLFTVQDALNKAADALLDTPDAVADGYAGAVAAPENHELRIYWQGPIPATTQAKAAQVGVPVLFLPAAYSQRDLVAESDRLGSDPRVGSAAPNVDGSGVTVTVVSDADRAAIVASAHVPVTVDLADQPDLLYDRQHDTPSYWGGARWDNLTGRTSCSTGFGIRYRDRAYDLTAGHCGNNGNQVRVGVFPQPTVTIFNDNDTRDTQMLTAPSTGVGTYAGRVYTGPPCCGTLSFRTGSVATDYVGNWVCTGGAFSGEHCNIQVMAVNTTAAGKKPMTYAVHVPTAPVIANCAVAPGDSGGPVYSYSLFALSAPGGPIGFPTGSLGVAARGTITAGGRSLFESYTPCPGLSPNGYARVYYAPLKRPLIDPYIGSLAYYGASLLTS